MSELVLTLPAPPSVNNLFATVGKRRITSKRYASWQQEAKAAFFAQAPQPPHFGHVHVDLLFERNRRIRDLDNLIKAPIDFLVRTYLIEDDHLVDRITAAWSDTVKGMQITVRAA